jgi:rhamnogalacturonan endolyase
MQTRLVWPLLVLSACSPQKLHGVTPIGTPNADAGTPIENPGGDASTPIENPDGDLAQGHFQMERLSRGVVAVKVDGGVYVGWRMFGYEYDLETPGSVAYNLYRDGKRLATVTDSTNYLDPAGKPSSAYSVRAVIAGVEGADSGNVTVWSENYLRIPLDIPPAGSTPASSKCDSLSEGYTYDANDGSVGDLDGDGEYEIVLKWLPSNAKEMGQSGCTGNVYLDAYKLGGKKLWRIDLGVNIRAGAQYTQFLVYDLDGDGKAEVACKTAPGTRDGGGAFLRKGPAATDDDNADYRSLAGATGYVLAGPEYLTVFAGTSGAELATVDYDVPRGDPAAWGDDSGDRVDVHLASVGFVSDLGRGQLASGRPSLLVGRGGLDRTTLTAWSWREGQLAEIWRADSNADTAYAGQATHTMMVADVDGDGAQEIVFGSSTIDSDGTRKCSTGLGHGDALHVGDLVLARSGLEVFVTHDVPTGPPFDVHDANTCEVTFTGPIIPRTTTQGICDDISPTSDGAEILLNSLGGLASAAGKVLDTTITPPSTNFLVYWDADESRELESGTTITRYTGEVLQSCSDCASNNGSKATPVLAADLLGDWREEIIWREPSNAALRLYTTTAVTARRLFTLMHDAQYRMQVSAQQTGNNQPPHPSFHIGNGMTDPPRPDILVH